MPAPLIILRQKSRKWLGILFGGIVLLMAAAWFTASPLFVIGVAILFGYVIHGVSKEIRCPLCGLFDPIGMWRLEAENLFKRRSACPQCLHDLAAVIPPVPGGQHQGARF